MTDEVRSLIDALRKGEFDDPDEKVELLAAALVEEGGAPSELLLKLLNSPQALLRRAALLACRGRKENEILERMRAAAEDEDWRVREALAKVISPPPSASFWGILEKLSRDKEWRVQVVALRAESGSLQKVRSELLLGSNDWRVRQAAAETLGNKAPVIPDLFKALSRESDEDVKRVCASELERALESDSKIVAKRAPTEVEVLEKAEKQLLELGGDRYPKLLRFLQERTAVEVSAEELAQFGTDLAPLASKGTLPRPVRLESLRERLAEELFGGRRRSLVLLGEPGVGKSALVHELAYWAARPENGGWHVLRMSPTDFMVGTTYIGEWETRVANVVKAIRRPRRVLLYVPNFGEFPGVGKHSKSEHSILTALTPFIEEGSIQIVGESTVGDFERGFRAVPAARTLFKAFLIEPPDVSETGRILREIRGAVESGATDEQLDQIIELADQFVPGEARPGNAIRLFQSVQGTEARTKAAITTRLILEALASSSGLPADLMDDEVPLDLAGLRSFFESRVLGQAEGVNAVVELVTLIKAGLTDPMKPMGVFLFVGPTGVGKTELARALAEYIFGNPNKMLRFDMSEYATAESFQRLIDSDRRGSLTNLVRQTPFSVVLLDEIEKSHVNVFDLCLQLFDAGRLTDDLGRTTDFRKSIVVLTSNVGAGKDRMAPIGFRQESAATTEPDKERTFRELAHFFRPEFLNRIDRIVYFRPLELQVAENIARKEIERVLGRTGITRRKIAVEVDPAVLSILIKEGYSPAFGARPLKRAVEKLLLLPVARMIASGKSKEASLLRLKAVDGRIEPQLIRQESGVSPTRAVADDPRDLRERTSELEARLDRVLGETSSLKNRKEALLAETQETGFYKDAARTARVFDEIHRLDQLLTFAAQTGKALEEYRNHLTRSGKGTPTQLEGRFRELRRQVWCIETIMHAPAPAMNDALVELSLVFKEGESIDGLRTLAETYLAYLGRLPLSGEFIAEGVDAPTIYLRATGVGACALLLSEGGLHEFTRTTRRKLPRGKEVEHGDKEIVRVAVWAGLEPAAGVAIESKTEPARKAGARLLKGELQIVSLFDAKSARSLRVIAKGPKSDALAQAMFIFAAQGGPQKAAEGEDGQGLIRRYEFGIGSKARDLRSGANTPHLDRFFKGQVDLLVMKQGNPGSV